MPHRDIYQEVTNSILSLLEQGVVPWRKSWTSGRAPQNLISGKAYQGMNSFLLAFTPYTSPYWLTFNQAKARGGFVRKGERGTKIIFWHIFQREVEQDGETTLKSMPYLNEWTVFNVEQCDGIQTPAVSPLTFTAIEAAEQIIHTMPLPPAIKHMHSDSPYYVPALDAVHMPRREQFTSSEAYYATLFHELAHSTGHKSRLARPDLMNDASFGSEPYSREELVAEMTAAMLCGVTGIAPLTVQNSAAYLKGWLSALKNDKKLLIAAASQAQKAADFILNNTVAEEEMPAA